MKKMLMVASVTSMIGQFNMSNIELLQSMGYEVQVACNFENQSVWTDENRIMFQDILKQQGIQSHQICFSRWIGNIKDHCKAFRQLLNLLRTEKFDFIHCHTPICGILSRLAAFITKTKVIYTAHGFHFYHGAPLRNWLLYFPFEWLCSWMTDVLITINKEDYKFARSHMHAKKVRYVPGTGIDLIKFSHLDVDKEEFRRRLGIPAKAKIILSVGELNKNKNHAVIIRALSELKDANLYYIICGQGKWKNYLENLAGRLGVSKQVKLLGFKNHINEICSASDLFVFPSYREGLPVALLEAMANGLPCIVSDIRGNRDLIHNEKNGFLVAPGNSSEFAIAITNIMSSISLQKHMIEESKKIIVKFSLDEIEKQMKEIYYSLDNDNGEKPAKNSL